jgi:hypothetical protein
MPINVVRLMAATEQNPYPSSFTLAEAPPCRVHGAIEL